MNRETRKLLKKFKSRIARGNPYGKAPNFYAIDEILPPSLYCGIVGEQHLRDTKKREIPMRAKGANYGSKKSN